MAAENVWEIVFKMNRGFFPSAPFVFDGDCFSLSKLFQSVLFFFSLQEPTEPTSLLCSVLIIYTRQWWWWSGGMDTALFPCISTPRGMLLLQPTLSFC